MRWRVTTWLKHYFLLVLFLALQFGYWHQTRHIRPNMGIVPDVPGREAVHALTFGDDQFYFRLLAFRLQNSGDTFGRFTSLRYYDFNKLYHWFNLLDELDARSNMIAAMACYYFSQTQNVADVRYVVDYLYTHSTRDIGHKWWWLVQSIYLAQHKLKDMDLALKVASPLVNQEVPVWAQQMAAVVHEKRGEMDDALNIMMTIKENAEHIPEADLKYMTYFIEERLGKLGAMEKEKAPAPENPSAPQP
jgi:hypothetical protein